MSYWREENLMVTEHLCDTREKMLSALEKESVNAVQDAVQAGGKASLMVSGGGAPGPLYEQLSQTDLDWSAISVALVDERWVEPGHDKSNESLVVNTLLKNKAAKASLTGMKNAAERPVQGLARSEERRVGMASRS